MECTPHFISYHSRWGNMLSILEFQIIINLLQLKKEIWEREDSFVYQQLSKEIAYSERRKFEEIMTDNFPEVKEY